MNTKTLIGAILVGAFALGSPVAMAQANPAITAKMDLDKDGNVSRVEFLTVMTQIFDKHAGGKDYCTPAEAMLVKRDIDQLYIN